MLHFGSHIFFHSFLYLVDVRLDLRVYSESSLVDFHYFKEDTVRAIIGIHSLEKFFILAHFLFVLGVYPLIDKLEIATFDGVKEEFSDGHFFAESKVAYFLPEFQNDVLEIGLLQQFELIPRIYL